MKSFLRILLVGLFFATWQTSNAQNYCEYNIGFAWCDSPWSINDVTIGTFSQLNSGCNSGPYNNGTANSISFTKGTAVPFTLASQTVPVQWGIWIDLNGNGLFTDAIDFFWASSSASVSVTGSILVPTATTVSSTRIRIASRTGIITKSAACDFGYQAETQDFTAVLQGAGCPTPINLAATPGVSSATLTWGSTPANLYNIEYGLAGFLRGSGTTTQSTTNSKLISGLAPNTNYDFYVQTDCSASPTADSSLWNGPAHFVTQCAPITVFPAVENFDNNSIWKANTGNFTDQDTISNCWNRLPIFSYNYAWILRTGPTTNNNTGPSSDKSGTGNYLYTYGSGSLNDEAFFYSPTYNTTTLATPYVSFYYHMFGSAMGNLYFDASSNGGQTWTTLDSIIGQQQPFKTNNWLERGVDVSAFKSATFMYRVRAKRAISGGNSSMAIDEFTLAEKPACILANNVVLNNITGSSVQVNWTSNASQFFIEFGPIGFLQGYGNIDTTLSNTISYNNLTSDAYYDVYIKTGCGANGNSSWAGPYTFRTLLAPFWFEDLNVDFLPNARWSKARGAIANPTVFTSTTASNWAKDGWANNGTSGAARCNISSFAINEWLITELIDLGTGNNWELHFDVALTVGNNTAPATLGADDSLKVVISTDGGLTWNKTNTILRLSQSNAIPATGALYTTSLNGYSGIIKVGFYLQSTVANSPSVDVFIDNLGIRIPNPCPAPIAILAKNVTTNTVTLKWQGSLAANGYFVEYGQAGFMPGNGTVISGINADSVQVTLLNPTTKYDFYVNALCGTSDTVTGNLLQVITACPNIFSAPYLENFDVLNAGIPPVSGVWANCWTTDNATGNSYRWQTSNGFPQNNFSGPVADHTTGLPGNGVFMYTNAANLGIEATATVGPISMVGLLTPTLSFWYHMYGAEMGSLHVDISTDNATWANDFYVLSGQKQTANTDPWLLAKLSLAQYQNDTIYLRFRAIKGGSNGRISIDDVAINNGNGCISAAGLSVKNITGNAAGLAWSSFNLPNSIEWGPRGFQQGTGMGTVVYNINSNAYNLTGLTANTGYDYYLKDTCTGKWIGPLTFYTACTGPLNGTYTVNGTAGATNFTTLKLAVDALHNCGVSGPVTINLLGVKETDSYIFKQIAGISAINTVTFNGSGADTISSSSDKRSLFEFDGAKYITLKNMVLRNEYTDQVIWLHNQANHITIQNNMIYGLDGTVAKTYQSCIASSLVHDVAQSSGQNSYNTTIIGNKIYGGYASINFYGDANNQNHGLIISNNEFIKPSRYGVNVLYVDSVAITKNTLSQVASTYSTSALNLYSVNTFNISQNYLHIKDGYGIYMMNANNSAVSQNSTITNNIIVTGSNGNGVYISNGKATNFYHNSINSGDYALEFYGANVNNFNVINNIIVSKNRQALYTSVVGSGLSYSHNIYKSKGNIAVVGGQSYADLAAWKMAIPTQNTNSLQGDPHFVATDDLHIAGTLPNNVGNNTLGVLVDFDGDIRPASGSTSVDIGADEFTPKGNDLAIIRILSPEQGCGDSLSNITAIIKNMGTNPITSAQISAAVTGDISATFTAIYTGNLANLAQDTVQIGVLNTHAGAQAIQISVAGILTNDEDASNNSLTTSSMAFIPKLPKVAPADTVCFKAVGSAQLRAVNYPGVNYAWYTSATAPTPTYIGDTFTFSMATQTNWYLGYSGNKSDSLKSGFFNAPFGGSGGVMFDITAKTNVEIDSFDVHSRTNLGTTGSFVLRYIANDTYANNEEDNGNWITLDSVQYVSASVGGKTRVVLNNTLKIPGGATYAVYLDFNGFFTDIQVPLPISNSLITQNGGTGFLYGSFDYVLENNMFEGITYAHSVVCSDTRTLAVLPLADTAMAVFTTNVSQPNKVDVDATASNGHLYEWFFGDGATATTKTASHTYTSGGSYTIICIVTDTVCNTIDTATFSVQMTIGIQENPLANALQIFPNPSQDVFYVSCDLPLKSDVKICVFDATGREIYTDKLVDVNQLTQYMLDMSQQPSGLYFVHIGTNQNTAIRKITKM